MRPSQAATVGAMLSLAMALPGCGAGSASDAGAVDAPPVGSGHIDHSGGGSCRSQLRPVIAAMDALRTDLAVGLSYDRYLAELHGARAAHRRIRADRLQLGCLVVAGAPAERALNRYVEAANAWGGCLAATACETASIEPRLQREWVLASKLLSAAKAGI